MKIIIIADHNHIRRCSYVSPHMHHFELMADHTHFPLIFI